MKPHSGQDGFRPAQAPLMRGPLFGAALLCLVAAIGSALGQSAIPRNRADGLYYCESANTVGSGNLWATGRLSGFIWDSDEKTGGAKPFPFLEAAGQYGILDILDARLESRLVSYIWDKRPQFGYVAAGFKATIPNNKDIRLNGAGLSVNYRHSFVKNFASVAGYRSGGTGFAPEGYQIEGGTVQGALSYEADLIALRSWLPLKAMVNVGGIAPVNRQHKFFDQLTGAAGVCYSGLYFDVFLEYSLFALAKSPATPVKFDYNWGWVEPKVWEVAFQENPMFLTVGGRLRYESGMQFFLCVPLLLSTNRGSDITMKNRMQIYEKFPDEGRRGIRDSFDPWYAKWKVIFAASVPLLYRQTGAEMRRTFLLMKNRTERKKIDIDEKLRVLEGAKEPSKAKQAKKVGPTPEEVQKEKDKRLEEIRKRREQESQEQQQESQEQPQQQK